MTLLGGLFSRKNKSPKREGSLASAEPDSAVSSPTTGSYVPSPLQPDSARGSPPSKLRRAFGRKKISDRDTPPQPTRTSTDTNSVDVRRLRPPPSRSAIFAAYGDPSGALSTRSLPSESDPPRRPSLFAWGKSSPSSPQSESSTTPAHDSSNTSDAHSFNLKAFRHVRPPSPTNVSSTSLAPPPRPRPRGTSGNSDSSQRISVAAFREAQARRSTAGSPVPDFRSPSPNPPIPPQPRSITPEHVRPRPARSTPHVAQQRPRSSMAVTSNSDSDESTSSSENDSEEDTIQVGKRSTHAKSRVKAKSEIGHAPSTSKPPDLPPYRTPRSHLGHSPPPQQRFSGHELKNKVPDGPPSSQSTHGVYTADVRSRASVSTSALSPPAAAKRANVIAASNSNLGPPSPLMDTPRPPQLRPQPSRTSLATTQARTVQSDSDSEDDAPLSSLVGSRRPGSAMSSYSNTYSRSTGNVTTRSTTSNRTLNKPLIDINELTRVPQRSFTSPNPAGFTEGSTLLSQPPSLKVSRALSASPSPMVESPVSMPPRPSNGNDAESLTRKVPPVNFISPPASPAKDMLSSTPDIEKSSGGGDGRTIPQEPKRDTNPEARRDPITDRLTRAVKKNLQPALASGRSSAVAVTGQNGHRRSASREVIPSSGDASDASRAPPRKSTEGARAAEAQQQFPKRLRPPRPQMPFPMAPKSADEHTLPDEELAQLLGSAVQFISRTGNTPPPQESSESSESESEEDEDDDEDGFEKIEKEPVERIAPILIKQRSPAPSFSVTSRPPLTRREMNGNADSNSNSTTSAPRSEAGSGLGAYTRPRSATLVGTSSSSSSSKTFGASMGESISAPSGSSQHKSAASMGNLINFPNGNNQISATDQRPSAMKSSSAHVRQRSVTMVTGVPLSAQMPAGKKFGSSTTAVPDKPFNKPSNGGRRNSPASSTGGSSSGRAPITPRDGSDIGVPRGDGNSKQQQPKKHRRSVSFEEDKEDLKPSNRKQFIGATSSSARGSSDGGETSNEEDREVKRRERRRSEAKAAIELGNVINGKGPIMDDDDDDMPINQAMNPRMSSLSPMMAMGNPMAMQMGFGGSPNLAPGGWGRQSMANMNMGMGGAPQMLNPAQFMVPPPADPNFLAAHQHAMMIAKQAYQMAVAQQAMAAAADEWERGSTVGGFGGGGGSVYGGSSAGPAAMMQSQFGMMGMMQGGGGGGWPATASVYGASRSMYGGSQLGLPMDGMMSSSRSEFGGATNGRGGNNWSSSRSTYGESFGPAQDQYMRRGPQQQQQGTRRTGNNGRDSAHFPSVPPMPAAQGASGRNSPDNRSRTKPTSPGRGPPPQRKAPPPSSWKLAM